MQQFSQLSLDVDRFNELPPFSLEVGLQWVVLVSTVSPRIFLSLFVKRFADVATVQRSTTSFLLLVNTAHRVGRATSE